MEAQQQKPDSQRIYDEWYASLDEVERELVAKVHFTDDDDYPLEIAGVLSHAAKERGGYHQLEKGYWTVMYRPGPPDSYFEARKREQEAKKAQEDQEAQQHYQQHQAERARLITWMNDLEGQGYIRMSRVLRTEPREGEDHHFDTGSFGTGVRFSPGYYQGQPVWYESYGNAGHLWTPAALAEQLYRQDWEERVQKYGEGNAAFKALSRIVSGLDCYGDDFYSWVERTFGLEKLVALAKAHAPIDVYDSSDTGRDLASKFFRIPLRMKERYPSEAFAVGYGYNRDTLDQVDKTKKNWEYYQRISGWVPFGEEDNPIYTWPTEADVQKQQESSRKYADFFSEMA